MRTTKMLAILVLALGLYALTPVTLGDWDANDGYKMHWPQLPDLNDTPMDVEMFKWYTTSGDDFLCTETGPITDIHIWGSFKRDELPGEPNRLTFEVSIYSNIAADQSIPWSRPGDMLWRKVFGPGPNDIPYTARQLPEEVWQDWYDPNTGFYKPRDHRLTFQYNFYIDRNAAFEQYKGNIYWLVIEEITSGIPYDYRFGWKTTRFDLRWNDDAVFWCRQRPYWYPLDYPPNHKYDNDTLDLAFVINCRLPNDGYKMHWPQLPDLNDTPMDVEMYRWYTALGDDFLCTETGPITDIHIWGSFKNDYLPGEPNRLTLGVGIYSNIAADQNIPWSRPGDQLWYKRFGPNDIPYTVRQLPEYVWQDWYDPNTRFYEPHNHKLTFQYNFYIDPNAAFEQDEGNIYWLVIEDETPGIEEVYDYRFGWKTTRFDLRWNDDAVWWPWRPPWRPLKYPPTHKYENNTLDLAFVINSRWEPAGGLRGDYYNNIDLRGYLFSRIDPNINFQWGNGSPDPRIDADSFSVRWTGQVRAAFTEPYTFYTLTDDGVRLWIDGQLIIDNWTNHPPTWDSGTILLTAGWHNIQMDYYEDSIGAVAVLEWSSPSTPRQVIPQSALSPSSRYLPGLIRPAADFNGDYAVDWADLAILLNNWLTPPNPAIDLNGDGTINLYDFAILANEWLVAPAQVWPGYPLVDNPIPECPSTIPGFKIRSIKWDSSYGNPPYWNYPAMNKMLDTGALAGIPGVQGGQRIEQFVNLHDSGPRGVFYAANGYLDQTYPGIDDFESPTSDPAGGLPRGPDDDNQFATEISACIELTAGLHTIGINSDDGAILRIGGAEVGRTTEFKPASTVDFVFRVVTAGKYLLQVRNLERGGEAELELHEVLSTPQGPVRILLGDVAQGGSPVYLPGNP